MSVWNLVKLDFGRNPAHFGELGIGIEETSDRLHSDTLFSALINSYARLFGSEAVEELLQRFLNQPQPPFRLSSTFLYRQGADGDIYYLPRPKKFPPNYPDDDLEFFKSYKDREYLPLCVWRRWYQGEGFKDGDRSDLIEATNKQYAGVLKYKDAYKIHPVPKIAVDRTSSATNLYYTGFVQFELDKDNLKSLSGLYFLLNFTEKDDTLSNQLHAALNLLGEEGIGGKRSSGAGRFEVELTSLPDSWEQAINFSEGNSYTLMNLLWEFPFPKELLEDASYEMLERGGWISSPFSGLQQRRKSLHMFAEGSVFSSILHGNLADVTPDGFKKHKVYRYGMGLSLPIISRSE